MFCVLEMLCLCVPDQVQCFWWDLRIPSAQERCSLYDASVLRATARKSGLSPASRNLIVRVHNMSGSAPNKKVVVVGGVAGGASFAARLRR